MPKRFCITGTCIPEKNYMVDISDRIDRIIQDYIENGKYFTINRARQYGKTTTLYLLERWLQKDYIVLSLSFEAADEYFHETVSSFYLITYTKNLGNPMTSFASLDSILRSASEISSL